MDLKAQGISDFGRMARGFGRPYVSARLDRFNDQPLRAVVLAQPSAS